MEKKHLGKLDVLLLMIFVWRKNPSKTKISWSFPWGLAGCGNNLRVFIFLISLPIKVCGSCTPNFISKHLDRNRVQEPSILERKFLRETQHTLVSHIPDIPFHPQMQGIPKHKLLVIRVWGMLLSGSVGKFLENWHWTFFPMKIGDHLDPQKLILRDRTHRNSIPETCAALDHSPGTDRKFEFL